MAKKTAKKPKPLMAVVKFRLYVRTDTADPKKALAMAEDLKDWVRDLVKESDLPKKLGGISIDKINKQWQDADGPLYEKYMVVLKASTVK